MKIKAFGKLVSREQAYQIIINDKLCEYVYASCTDGLKELLMNGWKPLAEWTDKELEEHIDSLCIESQPNGKI